MEENLNNLNNLDNTDDSIEDVSSFSSTEDDAYVLGKGFNIDNNAYNSNKKRKKNHSVIKTIVWLSVIIVISLSIAFSVLYVGADFMGLAFGRGENCVIEIAPGSSVVQIAEQLKDCGAVKIPLFFRLYSKFSHYDSQFKYGVYTFSNDIGYKALAELLTTQGAKAESVSVKIPEYATIDDIAVLLSDAGVCTKSDFYDVVQNADFKLDFVKEIPVEKVHYRLEGYLFPDTYDFYCYDSKECAFLAVEKMLKALDSKLDKDMKAVIEKSPYSFHELITMASIVESESANGSAEERAKVAAVFYNRLEGNNWDGPKFLQTDPSTYYPYGNGKYNTYKTEGLPPGPLGAPSLNSIKAALYPAQNFKATYFVTDKNADFYFNETLSAHNKTIADLKRKGLWLDTVLGS